MRSKPKQLRVPHSLAEAGEIRAKALGYDSWSGYVHGLIRYDLTCLGPHSVSLAIHRKSHTEQDKIDAELLALTKAGVGKRGSLLKVLIDRAMQDGATSPEEISESVAEQLKG